MKRAGRYRLPALAVGVALAVWWVLSGARLRDSLPALRCRLAGCRLPGRAGVVAGHRRAARLRPALPRPHVAGPVVPGRGLVPGLHPAPDGDRGRRLLHRAPGGRRSRCSGSPCSWSRWPPPSSLYEVVRRFPAHAVPVRHAAAAQGPAGARGAACGRVARRHRGRERAADGRALVGQVAPRGRGGAGAPRRGQVGWCR